MSRIDSSKKNKYCYKKTFKMQRQTNNSLKIRYIQRYSKKTQIARSKSTFTPLLDCEVYKILQNSVKPIYMCSGLIEIE